MGVQHDPASPVRAEGLGHARHEGAAPVCRGRSRRTLLLGSGPLRHRAHPSGGARTARRRRDPRHLPRAAPGPQLVPLPRTPYAARSVQAARPDVVLGVHLEGPFLGEAPGAHPVALLRATDLAFLQHVHDAYGALLRVVTLAPEADPGLRGTRALVERGVVVALGHSTVDFDGALDAADAGPRR